MAKPTPTARRRRVAMPTLNARRRRHLSYYILSAVTLLVALSMALPFCSGRF